MTHSTLQKVSEDIEAFKFNTLLSALMEFNNTLMKAKDTAVVGTPAWDEADRLPAADAGAGDAAHRGGAVAATAAAGWRCSELCDRAKRSRAALAGLRPRAGQGRHSHAGRAGQRQGARQAGGAGRHHRGSRTCGCARQPGRCKSGWRASRCASHLCRRQADQHRGRLVIETRFLRETWFLSGFKGGKHASDHQYPRRTGGNRPLQPGRTCGRFCVHFRTDRPRSGERQAGRRHRGPDPSSVGQPGRRAGSGRRQFRGCREDHHLPGRHGGFPDGEHDYAASSQRDPPARSTVQVAALPRHALVEIEMVAHVPRR